MFVSNVMRTDSVCFNEVHSSHSCVAAFTFSALVKERECLLKCSTMIRMFLGARSAKVSHFLGSERLHACSSRHLKLLTLRLQK